jgi:hypothetical protein
MSKTLELPDEVYSALKQAAQKRGTSPEEWIADQLERCESEPKTLYDLMKDKIGGVHSGGKERIAENASEIFGEILEGKRREGRL